MVSEKNMKLTFLKIFLIFLKTFQLVTSQNEYVMCYYDYLSEYLGYTCNLRIYNPNGLNNFIEINGTHMAGMTNNDVKVISEAHGSVSKNFPSIICSQFKNIQYILMAGTQIQRLDDYSFESCKNVTQINFFRSNITQLSEKTFESNENLVELQLDGNMLEELPPNIFSPLKNLGLLSMRSNNLKFISSDAFSLHQKLEALDFSYNQIYAVDEKFIDNTAVALIIMEGNLCANSLIFDDTPSRSELRAALRTCFENYENMMIGQ